MVMWVYNHFIGDIVLVAELAISRAPENVMKGKAVSVRGRGGP
jgi:hypothetical protein